MTLDAIIIGGGLMGSSTALHLALRGVRSLIIEKDSPGRHASGVNAGGLRQLNRDPVELPLSVEASRMWRHIRDLVGSDCDVKLEGQVRVAENAEDMAKLEERAALVRSMGYDHEEVIGRDALYRLVPALAPHCVGALLSRRDGFARPFHATTAFRRKAESLGVEYRIGERVLGLRRDGDDWRVRTERGEARAPLLINCAGAWAGAVAAALGEPVPLQPGAPMMMVTGRLPHFLDVVVGAASRKLSFKQMQNGTVLIGGAHLAQLETRRAEALQARGGLQGFAPVQLQREPVGTRLDFTKLAISCRTVMALFPHMEHVPIVRCWAGLEAFMPDHIPVIGPSSRAKGAYHAFGFSAHGFQLSPVVGKVMAELILDGRSSLPIEAFRIDRFH